MLIDIVDVFAEPESYVCVWRDGELYIRLVADLQPSAVGVEQPLAL